MARALSFRASLFDTSRRCLTARLPVIFLFLGVTGTVYDLALTRTYALLVDREQIPSLNWMGPAHDLARDHLARGRRSSCA